MSHHKHKRTHSSTLIKDLHISQNTHHSSTLPTYDSSLHEPSRAWVCDKFLPLSLCSAIRSTLSVVSRLYKKGGL